VKVHAFTEQVAMLFEYVARHSRSARPPSRRKH
jgi:hypothetical protein